METFLEHLKLQHDVGVLLSDGFPLAFQLWHSAADVIPMVALLSKKFEVNRSYALLLEAKWALGFAKEKFGFTMQERIYVLFRSLLRKGQRQPLKDFISVCKSNLIEAKYVKVRDYLFGDAGYVSFHLFPPPSFLPSLLFLRILWISLLPLSLL